jgi:hypothetical protein
VIDGVDDTASWWRVLVVLVWWSHGLWSLGRSGRHCVHYVLTSLFQLMLFVLDDLLFDQTLSGRQLDRDDLLHAGRAALEHGHDRSCYR